MATSSAARLNPRNDGLDLLRIIAMVMVCRLHGNMFTGGPELPVGHSAFCWVTSLPHVPPYSGRMPAFIPPPHFLHVCFLP